MSINGQTEKGCGEDVAKLSFVTKLSPKPSLTISNINHFWVTIFNSQSHINQVSRWVDNISGWVIQPVRACALIALGLLLADGAPTVQWGGGRLWRVNRFFFYENCCNFGTESQKNDPKVGNEPSLWGLQMGHWPKLGSYGKNRNFWPKTEICRKKKDSLLEISHVLATTGKSC